MDQNCIRLVRFSLMNLVFERKSAGTSLSISLRECLEDLLEKDRKSDCHFHRESVLASDSLSTGHTTSAGLPNSAFWLSRERALMESRTKQTQDGDSQ